MKNSLYSFINNNIGKLVRTILLLILSFATVFPQDPPDIKWKEINTKNYHIIFPHEIYIEANRVANTLEYLYPFTSKTLGGKHYKIPLILSNRSTISNGYVRLAPWKSEWFSVPVGNKILGQGEWYNTLAIHETRHMVQYSFLNRNLTRFFHLLGGEFGQTAFSMFCAPDWYWEGDAVCTETVLTKFGRGRLRYFDKGIRAILNNNISYSYKQSRFGSYKNYIPGHYEYGYFLTTHVKRKYGANAWQKILDNATKSSFRHPLNFFSGGLDKVTGRNVSQIYNDTMLELKNLWQSQLDKLNITPGEIISPDNNIYTKYEQPYISDRNEIYCVKSGFADVPQIVKMTEKDENKILQISYESKNSGVRFNENKIVWCENKQDKRWNKQSWSNIIVYDIDTGILSRITEKTRYFYPSISQTGKIAAVEFTKTRKCNLIILNSENGKIIASIPSPNNDMIQYSSWSDDENHIVFTSNGFNGKAMYILNLKKNKFYKLINYSNEEIFRPVFWKDYIIYESAYSGIDNLNAIRINDKKIFQVACRETGCYNPVVSHDKQYMVFSEYTPKGYQLIKMELKPTEWIPLDDIKINKVDYFEPVIAQEQRKNILIQDLIPKKKYEIGNYSGLTKYFNFHSWYFMGYENKIEANLYSTNILETMGITLSTKYNYNEKTTDFSSTVTYLGFYPKISGQISFENRISRDSVTVVSNGNHSGFRNDNWNEINFSLFADLPLIRSEKGPDVSVINFRNGFGIKKICDFKRNLKWNNQDININNNEYNSLVFPIYLLMNYQKNSESAVRDLVAPYQSAIISANFSIFNDDYKGSQYTLKLVKSLKSPLKHHGFIFNLDYEKNNDNGYKFSSQINTPDGYIHHIHNNQFKFKSQYKFPVFYPDLNILDIVYLKRFYASIYTDWMKGWGNFEKDYLTLGCAWTFELGGIFDINITLPVSVRTYYNPWENNLGIRLSLDY